MIIKKSIAQLKSEGWMIKKKYVDSKPSMFVVGGGGTRSFGTYFIAKDPENGKELKTGFVRTEEESALRNWKSD